MKLLTLYLFLIFFTLQTPSQADDIRDFQIEDISLGDSLLNYISKNDIDSAPFRFYPNSKKFKQTDLDYILKKKHYDAITVALKPNDPKYIIHEIKGFKRFSSHEECLDARDDLFSELKNLFNDNDYELNSYERETFEDKDSIYKSIDFSFETGLARIYCVDWSKKIREAKGGFYDDSLTVIIYDLEFRSFLLEMQK